MRGKWRERRNEGEMERERRNERGNGERGGKRTVESATILVTDEPPKVASLHHVHLSLFTLPTITSTPPPMVC